MKWQVKIDDKALKVLSKLDKSAKTRIENFIDQLTDVASPRSIGKALQGDLKGLWRYRVGDYRLICQIKDSQLIILVVEIGHRKDIYQ